MKTFIQILLIALFLNAINSPAQVYNILHNFGSQYLDGAGPSTDLVLNSNTLYGTTASGGTNYNGTIFKINTDGNGYGILRSLTNSPDPEGGMVLIGNTLYGTTFSGGSANNGTIFKMNTDGSGYFEMHSFSATVPSYYGTNSDGNRPQGDLVTDGSTL
ncbi:MAG TPA: choice-of-anchor tandem repeat GloVer-containing protein, partial [Candidatus Paceibacterota bacterium]|nr:choice-of-anchor tandem repeat GloVer-containing protein [Candidatus Paceibacterota bacterium]